MVLWLDCRGTVPEPRESKVKHQIINKVNAMFFEYFAYPTTLPRTLIFANHEEAKLGKPCLCFLIYSKNQEIKVGLIKIYKIIFCKI